jgi:hypothetical protein
VQAGEPVGREPRRDPLPFDARADPDAPGPRVDADFLQPADVQQQRAVEVAERILVVAGRLRSHAHPRTTGVGHGRGHVGRIDGIRNRLGMLVAEEVEAGAGLVPAGIAREHDGAGERVGEVHVSGAEQGCDLRIGHRCSFLPGVKLLDARILASRLLSS